jgi:hypothetical protein
VLSIKVITFWICGGLFFALAPPSLVAAQEGAGAFELPPPPDSLGPHRVGEFYMSFVFPVARDPLCPADAACIFGGGGGVGALTEWRWPRGPAVGFGYDLWFLNGNAVFELTTVQFLKAHFRYYGLKEKLAHPFVGVGLGFLLLGDVFRRNAVGAGVEGTVGVELELTSRLAFTSQLSLRAFATNGFRSRSDGVDRAVDFGVDVAASLTFGLVLLQAP